MKNNTEVNEEIEDRNIDLTKNEASILDNEIDTLYKIIAGFEIINQVQKRKLEGLNHKYGSIYKSRLDDKGILELYNIDKVFWDFIIKETKGNNLEIYDNIVNVYSDINEHENSKPKYRITYKDNSYIVYGKSKEVLYSSSNNIDIVNWIVTKNNIDNKVKRDSFLNKMEVNEEVKLKLTQPYVNDMKLDMRIALSGDKIKCELIKKLINFKNEFVPKDNLKSVDYLIESCSSVEVIMTLLYKGNTTRRIKFSCLEILNDLKISGCKVNDEEYKKIKGYIGYSGGLQKEYIKKSKEKLYALMKVIKSQNNCVDGLSEIERLFKVDFIDFLDNIDYGELIISMCEYDLLIKVDEFNIYTVNKVIMLTGVPIKLFEIKRFFSEKELVKWLFTIKKAEIENFDYLSF